MDRGLAPQLGHSEGAMTESIQRVVRELVNGGVEASVRLENGLALAYAPPSTADPHHTVTYSRRYTEGRPVWPSPAEGAEVLAAVRKLTDTPPTQSRTIFLKGKHGRSHGAARVRWLTPAALDFNN